MYCVRCWVLCIVFVIKVVVQVQTFMLTQNYCTIMFTTVIILQPYPSLAPGDTSRVEELEQALASVADQQPHWLKAPVVALSCATIGVGLGYYLSTKFLDWMDSSDPSV